jgi:hypothetical protein
MTIQTTTIVRKLKAFTEYSSNPIQYRESTLHNTMVDIDCTCPKDSCSVADLMRDHGMFISFYRTTLAILARDGYIELTEPDAPKGADYADPSFYDLALAKDKTEMLREHADKLGLGDSKGIDETQWTGLQDSLESAGETELAQSIKDLGSPAALEDLLVNTVYQDEAE